MRGHLGAPHILFPVWKFVGLHSCDLCPFHVYARLQKNSPNDKPRGTPTSCNVMGIERGLRPSPSLGHWRSSVKVKGSGKRPGSGALGMRRGSPQWPWSHIALLGVPGPNRDLESGTRRSLPAEHRSLLSSFQTKGPGHWRACRPLLVSPQRVTGLSPLFRAIGRSL